MKYSFAAISAFVAIVAAKPSFLNSNFDVTEGDSFTLKFDGCSSGCTIVVQTGPSNQLKDVKTLTSAATGDSFTFTPSGIPSGTYNFKIFANSDPTDANYSKQFSYQGTGPALSSGSSAASASVSATSAASSTGESSTESTSAATTSAASSSAATTSSASSSAASSGSTTAAATTTSAASGTSSAAKSTTVPGAGARATPFAFVAGAVAALAVL